ncbi:MAG: ATPase P, partial [Deltaproteobacteria bacterium]
MIEIDIPGYENLHLEHVVLDYNGTMAVDGKLIPGVKERLLDLAKKLKVHVLTADTFGRVVKELSDVPCKVYILRSGHEDIGKMNYVK